MAVRRGNSENNRLRGTEERDTLIGGAGNDSLFGLDEVDVLRGGTGNDLLDGGNGADRLRGGTGNDIYVVNDVGDRVIERADGGTDTVRATVSFVLGNNIENLVLRGKNDIDGTGNELDNNIRGNRADNTLNGAAGSDVLNGRGGNDVLVGGAGNDTLTGGAGVDRFTYTTGSAFASNDIGQDILVDFTKGTDRIVLSSQTFGLSSAVGDGLSVTTEFASVADQAAAETSTALIVFNQANNTLIYNQNGAAAGLGTGGAFATTTNVTTIDATDFTIVA